ncbi:MAG: hypothetical protein AB8F95_22640 [Bacteroidia bacterium]
MSALFAQKKIPIVLGAGFKMDSVTILLNRDTVFNKVLNSSVVTGYADEVVLQKGKDRYPKLIFIINGYSALTFQIDPKMLRKNNMIIVHAFSVKKFPPVCRIGIEIASRKRRFFY